MHLKDSELFESIFLWFYRLILAWFRCMGLQRGKVGSSVAIACSTLRGRPGLRPPGLMSICFTSHFSQTHEGVTSRFIGLWGDFNVIPLEEELGKIIEKVSLKIEQTEAP